MFNNESQMENYKRHFTTFFEQSECYEFGGNKNNSEGLHSEEEVRNEFVGIIKQMVEANVSKYCIFDFLTNFKILLESSLDIPKHYVNAIREATGLKNDQTLSIVLPMASS